MKKKTYFENLNDALISNNQKALAYRDGLAWDNKKRKTCVSHMPRGKSFRRLENVQWKKLSADIKIAMEELVPYALKDYVSVK